METPNSPRKQSILTLSLRCAISCQPGHNAAARDLAQFFVVVETKKKKVKKKKKKKTNVSSDCQFQMSVPNVMFEACLDAKKTY